MTQQLPYRRSPLEQSFTNNSNWIESAMSESTIRKHIILEFTFSTWKMKVRRSESDPSQIEKPLAPSMVWGCRTSPQIIHPFKVSHTNIFTWGCTSSPWNHIQSQLWEISRQYTITDVTVSPSICYMISVRRKNIQMLELISLVTLNTSLI